MRFIIHFFFTKDAFIIEVSSISGMNGLILKRMALILKTHGAKPLGRLKVYTLAQTALTKPSRGSPAVHTLHATFTSFEIIAIVDWK